MIFPLRAGSRLARLVLALLLVVSAGSALRAQVVETPEPFDAAGRVIAITPAMAAALHLGPPAWRITGDYQDARLYRLGNEGWVIVVNRRNGVVERYSITPEDREWLRERTERLPPSVQEQLREGLDRAARTAAAETRNNAFVRDQTILGLTVYAPSFATAVTNNAASGVAAYLLVAGGSFFAASSLARDLPISTAQQHLSTHTGLHGALAGWGIAYALDGSSDATGAAIFLGGIGGTAAGLYLGQQATVYEVSAASFAADAMALMAFGALEAINDDMDSRTEVGAVVAAGLLGYPLGLTYARRAPYNVTTGDVWTLWTTGAIGALLASAPIQEDPDDREVAALLTAGFAAGLVAGDRFLVRRLDHRRDAGVMVGLGATAGALMGAGLYALIDTDIHNPGVLRGIAAVGGIAGLFATEYYLAPRVDARRGASIDLMPGNAALAAAGVQGTHPVVRIRF
jgi:hypothetical protein